ncbi:MAG: DoxX family protein [Vicingaceae bacterium]
MDLLLILSLLLSFCFLFYGINCLFFEKMKSEFARFGLSDTQRKITGYLQILGSLGLALGSFLSPYLIVISSIGLSILMLLGFITRIRIKDSFYASFPALFFFLLNLYLAYATVRLMH